MKHATKRWECMDCDYTTTLASLAENHRLGHNHQCELVYEQTEIGEGWEPEEDE
jgi:hypothetical protein